VSDSRDIKAINDRLEQLIDQWHEGDSYGTLPVFLGMTHKQYMDWVKDSNNVPEGWIWR
jgi:hypothetical protein